MGRLPKGLRQYRRWLALPSSDRSQRRGVALPFALFRFLRRHGERLVGGEAGCTVEGDTPLAAVGVLNRPSNAGW